MTRDITHLNPKIKEIAGIKFIIDDLIDDDKMIIVPPFEVEDHITTEEIRDHKKGEYGIKITNKPILKIYKPKQLDT